MTARPVDSGSPGTVSDEAIAAWINSCPISPTLELQNRLRCVLTRGKTAETDQRPRQLSQAWHVQNGPKQCENIIDGCSKDVITVSPSTIDSDFNHPTGDDVHDQFSGCWRREVHDLLRICKDLVSISCRLSDAVLKSMPTNAPLMHESTVATQESPAFGNARLCRKEPDLLAEASPAPWDVGEECALPVELGTGSFDCLLQMLDCDISSD